MEKANIFGAIFMIATMIFTSCLEEGSYSIERTDAGVIRIDSITSNKVMDLSDDESIYSPAFAADTAMKEGTCWLVSYEKDSSLLPENSNEMAASNGYYTVMVKQREKVDQYYMISGLDTSKLLPNEIPIINPVYENAGRYVKGRLFIKQQFSSSGKQQTSWDLSYNPKIDSITKDSISGYHIYDVFLRATITTKGSGASGTVIVTNAYNMSDYFNEIGNIERGFGNKFFDIRFNYVSAIDTIKKTPTWKKSNGLTISVEAILPKK